MMRPEQFPFKSHIDNSENLHLSNNQPTIDDDASLQLRDVLHNGHFNEFQGMIDRAYDPNVGPRSGQTYWEQAVHGGEHYMQKRRALYPGTRPAEDIEYLAKLYEFLAVAGPDAYASTSGNEALVLKALLDAKPSPELEDYIHRIASSDHMGVFLLTETTVGSNASNIQTTVTLDIENGRAILNTPNDDASKFMPNVADQNMPKVTIIAARLIADNTDQGITLVAVPMHTHDEPEGITMEIMGHKSLSTPMPHAERISYNNVEVPIGNVVLGNTARIEDGQYINDQPNHNRRYHEAIAPLGWGRLGLSAGSIASVWAALDIHMQYAARREVSQGETIADQDDWQYDMAKNVVDVCALTALSNAVRRKAVHSPDQIRDNELLAWLEKPLITARAREIVMACADRTGSRGHFDANLFPAFLQNIQGALTAEGEKRVLERASGAELGRRFMREQPLPNIAERDLDSMPWWDQLVVTRATEIYKKHDFALGNNQHAINVSQAVAEQFALDALVENAERATGAAQTVLRMVADIYALEKIEENFGWYYRNGHMSPERAEAIHAELGKKYEAIIPLLPSIVDAFGIPDRLLNAPITNENYAEQLTQ